MIRGKIVLELLITCVFMLADFLLLLCMVPLHFYIGIPIYKTDIYISPIITLEEIGDGLAQNMTCKVANGKLIFRSRFSLFNINGIGILSIVKGDMRITGDKLKITQRANLTTVYLIVFFIYMVIAKDVDAFSYFFLGIISLASVVFICLQDVGMSKLCSQMAVAIKEEERRRQKLMELAKNKAGVS